MTKIDQSISSSKFSSVFITAVTLAMPAHYVTNYNRFNTALNVKYENSDYESFEIWNTHNDTKILLVSGEDIMKLRFEKIPYKNFILKFKDPLKVDYRIEDGAYYINCDKFEVYAYGETLDELKQSFEEELADAWDAFAECDDVNELSSDAIEIRDNLLSSIEKFNA